MAGGVATKTRKPKEPFGTGETKFPSRISKKYAEEQKTADEFAKSKLAWDKNPKDERITVDDQKVQEAYQQPFDRERFTSSFKEKISRDSLFERMSDFARFVGLPQEDLTTALPLQLDFGGSKRGGGLGMFAAAQFEKGAVGIRPYEGYDLSKFGYGEKEKQEAYGLKKLIGAKEKEIAKIVKTSVLKDDRYPDGTYDDGSFPFDREAYQKANGELDSFKQKSYELSKLKSEAEKTVLAEQNATSSATGRGTISFAPSMGYSSDTKNSTLYHEMTHQLFQGLRTKSAGSFDKYRDRVSSLFSGDNDDLADAFDSLTAGGGYSSADVVYGRSYKSNNLSQILSSYYRQNLDSSRGATPIPQDITKTLASLSTQSTAAKRAKEYRPINPQINEALLQGGSQFGMTQEKINRMEDNGKEEFLTTLVEKAPQLDQNLQGILDSTLTELLGGAGIQRQKFAVGGKASAGKLGASVYNLEKGSGLSSFEFDEAKRFADSAGYNVEEFKEYLAKRLANKKQNANLRMDPASLLRAITPEKNTSTPKQLALAETLKGEPDAGYRPILTEAQRIAANRSSVRNSALEDINNATRFAVGGVAEPEQKKEKQYGKIGLTEDGTMLNAGYFKNDTRSGYATAYKMRDYLYYVGLSSATSGYGPKLYDILMEAATEKGAMLTSDRSMVSGDAKNVWEYYFNNRPDVQKTPLKPSDWTRNNALIDPKLYGKEETWPPANDPAWILQSGYSKSPSLINSKDVIRSSAKVDSRALMSSFFSAKRGSSEPVVASNSNGEEFTVGYAKMAKGGKIDEGLDKYKQILSSILPPEFLSDQGFLKSKDGGSEEIEILSPKKKSFLSMIMGSSEEDAPPASYEGALPQKTLRHNLEKRKDQIDPQEYTRLQKYIDGALAWHGGHDVIDVRKSSHRGVLPHESFHDIQGFLYDNYPEIMDKLFASIDNNRPNIEDWYNNTASKDYRGPKNYNLSHFFPTKDSPVINESFGYDAFRALIGKKKDKTQEVPIPSRVGSDTVADTLKDLGRNETLPVLLSAASEGDSKAAEILSNIFGSAGLNKDFYKTLPRFATGGVVPGVGNSDTVPAMLNAGDFVIKKSSVNSVGTDKLASMAGYASGGSVSDQVPALLTPGEFVFSRSSAEKIGYNKLHSINNLGKFAKGGMVGGRLALAAGGEINPFFELAQRFFDHLNEVDSRKLPIRPGQNTSTSISLDGSTIDMVKELAVAIESLGIKSSDTAVLLRRGGDISYKAAQEAYEADLQKLKLSSASTEQIIKAENTLTQIREKSLRVTNNRSLIESSLFNSNTGQNEGFGAAQQKVLLEADKIEASIQRQKEKAFAQTLNTPSGGMFGASQADLTQAAKTLASSPEEKKDTKDTAFLSAMQKTTGINKSVFADAGLSGSDIRAYMSQSSLDRKTLAEMDKQLIRSKLDEVRNSQQFGSLSISEQKRRLDEVRELTQKEVATRRDILNEIARSQGLPSLSQKDSGSNIADFLKSPKGTFLASAIGLGPSLVNSFSPAPTNTGSAVARAATAGGSQTFAAGLQLAGSAGSAAPLVLLGTAAASLAIAFKEARNTFIDFEKQLLGKQLQTSINNLQQSFADLAKDIYDLNIRDNISRDLQSGVSKADRAVDMDKNYARSFMVNLLDAAASSNQNAASDRSRILERFGTSAYLSTTTMGTGSSTTAENNRKLYTERLIPERAQENAKQYSDVAQFAQKSLETMVQAGKSYSEIKASPEYDDIAASLAKANIKVQEQILAIENNNIENTAAAKANREAAKSAIIKAFADDQSAKITKNLVREREAELANRESRTFGMNFDRMFINMSQSIETTNYSLSKFSETVEASISAMSGQAKLGTTNLDSINTLKNLNISTPEQKETAINQASSLFGSERGLVSSVLSLGDTLESSIMKAINKTIQDNPGASDTKVSMEIEKAIGSRLSETNLPAGLTEQLSKQINSAVDTIRKKEGADTKNRRIDFSELIGAASGLKDTFDILKNTQNAAIAALDNWKNRLDIYSKSLDRAADIQLEAAQRRNKAEDILINGSIELSRTFGASPDPASAARLRDSRTARLTGGPTSVTDIVASLQSLDQTRENQRGSLTSLKNSTVGQTGSVQAIMDNERALSKTNYQINQTYAALKNLAESSEAASVAMNAVQSAQQKQAGKVSLLEKLIGSTPEELFNFNNALRRLQLTASGQQLGQTADQRKEVLSVMNDILPLLGNGQEANNLKASTLENLLKDSGVGVNIEFSKIISAIRNPEADPATKLAVEQLKQANEKQADANRALAGLGDNIAAKMIESSASILKSALEQTEVKFDKKQLDDILGGLRDVSTVVRPGEPDRKASGGIIYASAGSMVDFSPKGTDTVPAMLTPGEFVVNRSATEKHLPLLRNINSGNYANGGSVRYYADGGYVSSALKPEYKDGINLKKSGKLSTQYEYPDISSLEELRDNSVYFYTLKNLSKMPLPPSVPEILNLPSSGAGPNRDTKKYLLKSEFGVGFPSMGSMSIDTGKDKTSRVNFNRGPSEQASLRPVGRFISPGSEIFQKIIQTKKLEFDQPEDNAVIQRDLFKDLLTSIGNEDLIPRKISTSKNPKITSGSGDFDIIPFSESNQLKTELPVTVSMNREYSSSLGSRFKIFFSNLSDLIPQDVGMLNSKGALPASITDWTKLQGVSKDTQSLLDFFFTGSSVATKTFTDIGNKNSFTNPLTEAPTNAGNIRSGNVSESSNLEALANITKTIHDAQDNISKDKTFVEPDSDKRLKASLGFLRNLYQKTSVSEIVDSDLFDLRSLGATQDKIRVFSADETTWNAKYLEAIDSSIKSSTDKSLESLSYWGKPGAPSTSFSVYPEGGVGTRLLPWADAGVPISEDVNAMMQREVDTNIKNIIPDTSTTTKQHNFRFKKGPILSQDVSIPYQLDFTKYLNRYWDPDIDALSDEQILDGKPIYLLNPSKTAPENPFKSLPLGDSRRLFATESALMDNTIGNNIFSQLSSDNTFLEYLSAVINDGYTSEKATKLENPAIEKFQNILSVADKVGILDKISPLKDQRGELFVKNDNMFGGSAIKVNLRDFLQSSAKKLSLDKTEAKENNANKQFSSILDKYDLDRDGELSQDEKDEAKKDGVDVDRKSYFERSEYPGAALAMILGSQELFGPGGQYELPGVLGRNWFTPTISNAYSSIYDVPNDRIKSYMAELGSYISARFGDVDQSAMYAAQSDPTLYDSIKTAKSYMLGANEAFTKLSSGDTSSIVDFFPAGIFKNQTPNGDPAANKAAIEMFATLGRVSDSSPIKNAMIATGLSVDDQKEFSDKLENSMIAKISSKGDITWTKFSPDDLKNSRGEANFERIFDLALNPYSQFTNRAVRESLLDEFINAIPQARNTEGLPLFTATTGPEYDKSLRLMKKWYGGDGQVSVPLRSWPGVDYLYDQSIMDAAGEPLPFSTKFQELTANLDEQLYADAIMANNYIGGQKAFGDLPNIRFYEGKEPQYRNQGGIVYASAGGSFVNFKPKGPDVIPAMLSDGEFVVNAKQTAQHLPLLKAINDGDAIGSPIGFQDGGMAGVRPFGTPLMAGNSRPNFRARTISQARANRMRDIGFSSRLTDREIDPSNGDISWSTMFDGDSYKKTKGSIQAAFARIASTDKPESFDNYQTTTKFFQDLRVSFEKEKSKKDTKIEDYRKAQRFISGLEKEYLLASRGGGIRLFENDGIFKDKGLEYDDISDKVSSLRDEADKQFEKDPKERAKRMKGLDTTEKNLRIAKIGTPPRLSEKGMDPATGALSFTPGIKDKDNNFESTSKVQNDFTDMAGRGQESRLSYDEYKVKLDNIRNLRSELKTKVDDMDAAAYGRSASYLDSLERELELSARGGGLGVKSKPDMYKPRPYLSTPKQRISVMNKPGEINDQFLDPKTGKITWPLALTDSSLDDTRKKVDTIYSELMTSDNSNMSYEDFAEKRQELQNLTEEFKENINKHKSGNYGEAKSFLDALTNNFNNVGNKGKDKANTDWRLTGDPKGVSVNGSFLAPDGSISWPSAILRDPAFAKYRTAIENDMKNAADLDGAKFDPKQSSSFKDFMDELKDKQEDFGGFDGEHYQARSFIDGLQRSYNNAGQGKPLGGMTLSDYKTQQAEKQEQERQQKQEQERQEGVDFRRRYPVQMLSSSPEAAKSKTDKMADSMTYSSMASMMKVKPAPETKLFKPKPTAAGLERERQRSLDLEYETRAERTKERVLANVEKEGAWDVDAYDAAYRRVMRSGTPTKERWKAAQYREAVEKELSGMSPEYAQRQWKDVTPSTYYTNSPEYKAKQEKKQKQRDIRGPYAPGFAGAVDEELDKAKVFIAQASTLPIRTAAAVSGAMLEIGLPPDYSEQKRAVDKVRTKDQERATALTPQENSRLAEQRRRVAVGADRDMFGANVGDKTYAKFLKLSPEDQKEYLSLRDRAQKGMSPTEYTRLDYLQKTLEVPYQQKQFIPKAYESDAVVPTAAKKNASIADQMRDIPKKMPILPFGDNRIPLIGSRQDTEQLPGAFEEGATFGTVFTKGVAPYVQKTEEAVQGADQATKEVAIGTGKVLAGSFRVGTGATSYMMAKGAAGYFDAFGLPNYAAGARAFEESSDEFAQIGLGQIFEGAAGGVGKRISPEFYANEEKKSARIYQKLNSKREKESEELLPGYGAAIYAGFENLTTNAATVAIEMATAAVAFKYGKMAINAIPDAPPAKTFTPAENAARAVANQQLDDVFTGRKTIRPRPPIDDPNLRKFLKRPMFVGENPPPPPDVALDKFLGRSSQQTTPSTPIKFTTPPKPSTWTNGVQPPPSQSWTETQQRLAKSQLELQALNKEISQVQVKDMPLPAGVRGQAHRVIDSKTGKLTQDIRLDSGLSKADRAIVLKHESTHVARNATGYRMNTGQLSQDSVAQLPENMTKYAQESFTIRTQYDAMKAAGQKIPPQLEKLNAQFRLLEEEIAYSAAGQANAANPALRISGSVDKYRALVKQIEETMSSPATSSSVPQATSTSWRELMEFPNGRPKPEGYNLRLSTPDSPLSREMRAFNEDVINNLDVSTTTTIPVRNKFSLSPADTVRYDPEAIDYKGSASTAAKIIGAATVGAGVIGYTTDKKEPPQKEPQKKALGGFIRKYATGGRVAPSFEKSPYAEGTDTVPAMLSEGEFVVNARDTARNLPLLEKLNKGGLAYLAGGGQPFLHKNQATPRIPHLNTPEETNASMEAWMNNNYTRSGEFSKNRQGVFQQVKDHLDRSPDGISNYNSILNTKLEDSLARTKTKIPFTINEDSSQSVLKAHVDPGQSPPELLLPNNPKSQYAGENVWASWHEKNEAYPKDQYYWGKALSRPLIGLHENEHLQQGPPTLAEIEAAGMKITPMSGAFGRHPVASFYEPAAVMAERVHAADAAKKATGKPVEGNDQLAPNYAPKIDWMRQQAQQHGYSGLGGDKNMTELLNTPAGQAWMRMQMQNFSDAGNPEDYTPPPQQRFSSSSMSMSELQKNITKTTGIPFPTKTDEKPLMVDGMPISDGPVDPRILYDETYSGLQYAMRRGESWPGIGPGRSGYSTIPYDIGPAQPETGSKDNFMQSMIKGTYDHSKSYRFDHGISGEALPREPRGSYYNDLPPKKSLKLASGGLVYLAEGSSEPVKPTWWSRTKDFGKGALDVGLGTLESTLGMGQLAVGTATGLTTMAAGKMMGDDKIYEAGKSAMYDMNRSAADHMEAGAARGVGKYLIDPAVGAVTGAFSGKSSSDHQHQEGFYSKQLENTEAKLASEPTWASSNNPVLAAYGGGGAGVYAQADAVNGAMQVGGAGVLSAGSAFADMGNTLSYGVGLTDKNSYDQRSAGIQAFNASMEANAEAGAQDIKTALMIGSGFMSAQELGSQSASAKLNAKEVESLKQDKDFGELAASTTQFADATSYAAANAAFGMKVDPLAPLFKGLKAAENIPETARRVRSGTGKLLNNKDLVFSASDARYAAKNLVEGAIPEATVLSGTQNTGWITSAEAVAGGTQPSNIRTTGGTGMRAYTEVPVPGKLSKVQALEEAKRLTVGGDTKRTTVSRSWSDWFAGKDWKGSTPGHAGHAVYGTINDMPGAEQAARYAADGLSAKDVLKKGTVMGFNVDPTDIAKMENPFTQNPSLNKAFSSLPEATPAGSRTSAEVFNEAVQSMEQKALSQSPTARIKTQALIDANLDVPGYKFSMGDIDPNTVKGATGLAFPSTAMGNVLPTTVTGGVNAKTLEELVKRRPFHFAHNTQHAVEAIDTVRRAELYAHDLNHIGLARHGDHNTNLNIGEGDQESYDNQKLAHKATGGLIYANNGAFMPKGKDKVPAMLTPGEFVVNSEATQKNLSLLQDINNGSIQYASNGALIGAKSKNIDTRPSENERSVLGAIGTGYYSRGGIVEYLNYGGRAKSQFIGEPPIASGNALYRPENERTQYQTMQYAAPAQDNIVNQSTNMATQSGVLNNNTNMQSSSVGGGFGGMDITAIQRVFENFRQDLTVLQESVTQFSTGAETMASSATQYKEVSTNIASSSDKLANLSLPDQLNVSVTSNLDKLGASVTSEISGTIMRSNQGLVNGLQNYSDSGDKAIANKGFNDSEGALKLS